MTSSITIVDVCNILNIDTKRNRCASPQSDNNKNQSVQLSEFGFTDHKTGEHGNAIEFYAYMANCSYETALSQLGMSPQKTTKPKPKRKYVNGDVATASINNQWLFEFRPIISANYRNGTWWYRFEDISTAIKETDIVLASVVGAQADGFMWDGKVKNKKPEYWHDVDEAYKSGCYTKTQYAINKNIPLSLLQSAKIKTGKVWNKRALIVPRTDVATGDIQGYQVIFNDGQKRFINNPNYDGDSKALITLLGCELTDLTKLTDLWLTEGLATGSSIYQAINQPVAICFTAYNLAESAKTLRVNHFVGNLTIASDNDRFTDGNTGKTKAWHTARLTNAMVALPQFDDLTTKPTDFNDLHKLVGINAVKQQLEQAQLPPSEFMESIAKQLPHAEIVTLNERYLPTDLLEPYLDSDEQTAIFIKALWGQGKTRSTAKPLAENSEKFGFISHLQSLGKNAGSVLEISSHTDHDDLSKIMPHPKLTFCINGVINQWWQPEPMENKGKKEAYPVLFVDEAKQVLSAIVDGTVTQKLNTTNEYHRQINQTKLSCFADADMDLFTIQHSLPENYSGKIVIIENQHNHYAGRKITHWGKRIDLQALAIQGLRDGEKVLFATGSKQYSDELFTALTDLYPTKNIMVVNSQTSKEHGEFIKNISNESYTNLDCLIFTPTLSSGVSIDKPHFTLHIVDSGRSLTVDAILQMMNRDRNWQHIHTHIPISGQYNKERLKNPNLWIDEPIATYQNELNNLINSGLFPELTPQNLDRGHKFFSLWQGVKDEANKSRAKLRENFLNRVLGLGMVWLTRDNDIVTRANQKALRKQYRQETRERFVRSALETWHNEPLTTDEATKLKEAKLQRSEADIMRLHVYDYIQFYGSVPTFDELLADDNGQRQRELLNLASILADEQTILGKVYDNFLDKDNPLSWDGVYTAWYLRKQVLTCLGITVDDGQISVPENLEWSKDSLLANEPLMNLFNRMRKSANGVKGLGATITEQTFIDPVGTVNDLLRACGFALQSKQKRTPTAEDTKQRTRFYSINIAKLHQSLLIAMFHVECHTSKQEVINNNDKTTCDTTIKPVFYPPTLPELAQTDLQAAILWEAFTGQEVQMIGDSFAF